MSSSGYYQIGTMSQLVLLGRATAFPLRQKIDKIVKMPGTCWALEESGDEVRYQKGCEEGGGWS